MSGTDNRLRELMDAAVGEPPGSISVPKVRRLARRRRTLHGITAASATVAAVSVLALGLATPLFGHSSAPPSASPRVSGVPRYYIQQPVNFPTAPRRVLVRDTATGAVTAIVRCPWGTPMPAQIAATRDEAFFLGCHGASVGFRLYRFQVTGAGSVRGFSLVPGGAVGGAAFGPLTADADGSEIAVQNKPLSVLVINTRTGAHAVWRGNGLNFTLSPNGRYLRFVSNNGVGGDLEVRQVGPASQGGQLSSARLLIRVPKPKSVSVSVSYARVSPGGSVLTLAAFQVPCRRERGPNCIPLSGPVTAVVEQISVPSGRVIRVLFRGRARIDAGSDPTGRYIILQSSGGGGWLKHGHLVPLAPAHGLFYETW